MDSGLLKIQLGKSNEVDEAESARRRKDWNTRDWILNKSALLSRTAVQWSVAKINLNVLSWRGAAVEGNAENTVRNVKLFGKNQWFVQIHEDGSVSGTHEQGSSEVNLQLESLGKGLVHISHVSSLEMKRYLAMDSNGRLFATKTKTDSTIFKHVKGLNGFHTFSSHKYYKETPNDMFIALKKDGLPRRGNKTCRLHKGSQFLLV